MSAKTEVLGALSIKYTGESPPEGRNGKKVKSGVRAFLNNALHVQDVIIELNRELRRPRHAKM